MSREKILKELKKKNPFLNKPQLEKILNCFTESFLTALKNKNCIEIRGFGRWYLRKLKENFNLRNPSNNELIYRPERFKLKFKASKELNRIINE